MAKLPGEDGGFALVALDHGSHVVLVRGLTDSFGSTHRTYMVNTIGYIP